MKTLLGQKYLALEPKGSGQMKEARRSRSSGRSPPTTSSTPSAISRRPPSASTPTRLATSLNVMASEFKDGPPHVKAALSGLTAVAHDRLPRRQLKRLLASANRVSRTVAERNKTLETLIKDADLLMVELDARREAIHTLFTNTSAMAQRVGAGAREPRGLKPALDEATKVLAVLQKHEKDLNDTIAAMAPFTRLCSNVLANGRWFDTYIANLTVLWAPRGRVADAPDTRGPAPAPARAGRQDRHGPGARRRRGRAYAFWPREDRVRVTGEFQRAVGLFPRLGRAGPRRPGRRGDRGDAGGDSVLVEFEFDRKHSVPADAKAAVVAPSLVSDRYVQAVPGLPGRPQDGRRGAHRARPHRGSGRASTGSPRASTTCSSRSALRAPTRRARSRACSRPGPTTSRARARRSTTQPRPLPRPRDPLRWPQRPVRHREEPAVLHLDAGHERPAGAPAQQGPRHRVHPGSTGARRPVRRPEEPRHRPERGVDLRP